MGDCFINIENERLDFCKKLLSGVCESVKKLVIQGVSIGLIGDFTTIEELQFEMSIGSNGFKSEFNKVLTKAKTSFNSSEVELSSFRKNMIKFDKDQYDKKLLNLNDITCVKTPSSTRDDFYKDFTALLRCFYGRYQAILESKDKNVSKLKYNHSFIQKILMFSTTELNNIFKNGEIKSYVY